EQASEAMEVLIELMEIEVSIIVPHIADIVRFCLEVGSDTALSDSLRVKALSCITFLIKLKSNLMPLLLGYLSSLSEAKIGHVTKVFYALENFMENLDADQNALECLQRNEMRPLQNQSLGKLTRLSLISPSTRYRRQQTLFLCPDTLAVLARTMGKDVFGPLAAECIQLGLKLTDAIDDPDLRRCTYDSCSFFLLFSHTKRYSHKASRFTDGEYLISWLGCFV
ncbi:hypothetical protein GOODEAATRI_013876, partial [Goodea atripinnis]